MSGRCFNCCGFLTADRFDAWDNSMLAVHAADVRPCASQDDEQEGFIPTGKGTRKRKGTLTAEDFSDDDNSDGGPAGGGGK